MAKREQESNGYGTRAILHPLAGDVVDCGNMVEVNCMAYSEAVGVIALGFSDGSTLSLFELNQDQTSTYR